MGKPDATGLPRGVLRSLLRKQAFTNLRCHGLAPWSFTFAMPKRKACFCSGEREAPRDSPWHLGFLEGLLL